MKHHLVTAGIALAVVVAAAFAAKKIPAVAKVLG